MGTSLEIPEDDYQFDIEKLRRQEPAEFERLYQHLAPKLRHYLTHLSGDLDEGFDLSQETFVKVYRALPRIKPGSMQLRPWIYKIGTNTAYSAARKKQFKQLVHFTVRSSDYLKWSDFSGSSSFENRYEEAEIVKQTLQAIKPEYRAVLLLHWREGFNLDELCQILNLSKDNLKKRLYRAKQAFSAAYSKECSMTEEGRG